MLPMITEPTPTLAVPDVTTSPSILAASAKNSEPSYG
jgi:transaldolase